MLMLDVECVGEEAEELDPEVRAFLIKGKRGEDALNELGLSPYTGQIVAASCWSTEHNAGVCLLAHPVPKDQFPKMENVTFIGCKDEKGLLERLWDTCSRANGWGTYNGRSFDIPYATIRSAVHGVEVHHPLVQSHRYYGPHVDLKDRMEFFGTARFPCNFDLLCRTLGVKSPKGEMSGAKVEQAWRAKEYIKVATYNIGDVIALKDCFERVSPVLGIQL
jgi:3'-5' exonuclease